MSLFDLSGKVALVTGATKGIGRGIVERLAEHGARVVVSSRRQGECDQVAADLRDRYGNGKDIACGFAADIRDIASLDVMVGRVLDLWGRIDVLVCNAAIQGFHGPSAQTPDAAFRDLLESNIFNYFKLCHMVSPQMVARRDGSIIFIGSAGGLLATPGILAYAVAKAGENHLARCLAAELAPHNVRVNTIAPGSIRTETSRPLWQDPEILKEKVARTPLARIGEPDEIAAGVVFLAGAGGAYTTGVTIPIDGGVTMLGHTDERADAIRKAAFAKSGGFAGDYKT